MRLWITDDMYMNVSNEAGYMCHVITNLSPAAMPCRNVTNLAAGKHM